MTEPIFKLAHRMSRLRASEIREMLKVTARPEVISFAGGLPAPELFPVEELIEVGSDVLRHRGGIALQYSTTEGDPRLRAAIASHMQGALGIDVDAEQILITSGSQQGLDLTGRLLIDEGDEILCESPTYIGAIQAFNGYLPTYIEVPTDDHGMDLDALEASLARARRARLIYVVPDFQNPSGRCWSLERRQGLLELARRYRIPVIEDAPYAELRFHGEPIPSLRALDDGSTVVFLGTFSKILCPGLRIGWLAASPWLRARYVLAKQGADLHTSTLSQMQLAEYLERYEPGQRLELIRQTYRHRRNVMVDALTAELPEGVRLTRPEGGLFLWLELPEHLDIRHILERCLEADVAAVPGGSFFPNGGHEATMRLCFASMPPERIVEGVRRLARVIREALDERPHRRARSRQAGEHSGKPLAIGTAG
jgi:DNA-binding transcriptional MocR family regulator